MKFGRIRKDESGHDYLVPEERINEFDILYNKIMDVEEYSDEWHNLIEEFENKFGKYRSGGYRDYKVLIE